MVCPIKVRYRFQPIYWIVRKINEALIFQFKVNVFIIYLYFSIPTVGSAHLYLPVR
jgi:hypothetical protein